MTQPSSSDPLPEGTAASAETDAREIRFLFRFRDFTAGTIAEHIKIIESHRACLWGWWQRPGEGPHEEVWQYLGEHASEERPVKVGLFHSGLRFVYEALVTGVKTPKKDEYGNTERVKLDEKEAELVPPYYRGSPYSMAWLRLKSINPKEINFFGRYSFDKVPKLPNHTPKVLDLLRNKVIVDAEELRSMDTTIWQVRPRNENDSVEQIYLTTHSLALSVSPEAVTAPSNTILHLTDPHFSLGDERGRHVWRLENEEEDSRPSLSQAVMNAVEMNKRQVGLVIVTGDLTFKGHPKEFDAAENALRQLLMRLKLDKNNLVVIPGNHDIVWAKGEETYKENARVDVAPEAARENYVAFHTKLFGYAPNDYLSMGRRFSLPCGVTLEVCAVNSSALATGKNFLTGMGYVQEEAIMGISKELGWAESRSLALRLLAVHHHLALTENFEPAGEFYHGFGIAANAPQVMRLAAKHGVHLALHGHKHRAFVWRSKVYELPEHTQDGWYRGELSIVGGGSAGSCETEGRRNYFNLIDVSSDGLALEIYRAENDKPDTGTFSVMQRWKADLDLDKTTSSLKLGDWTYVRPAAESRASE